MEPQFVYQKKRSEFGRQCLFSDKGPDLIDNYPSDKKLLRKFILRDPVSRQSQNAPIQSEHELNTTRAEYSVTGMNHVEGGWPKDVNLADEEQTKRYRRKIEKDEAYYHTVMQLFRNMEKCVLQNNAINIYQQYFEDVEAMPLAEICSARTVNVYQDQSNPTRPVNRISWSPDNQTKLAISYCNLKFQANVANESKFSYIWEVENPNRPLCTLKPLSAIVCLEYHQKDPNCLASGHINGQIGVWDIRKGPEPVDLSDSEISFRDPVNSILWINSKSGMEFFSCSSDGQVKWWDLRKLGEPLESLLLDYAKDNEQKMENAFGGSCLEYESTIPTRFMVGTEQGYVISGNRKGKTAMEKMPGKFCAHLGPVLTVERSPFFVKNFLTVGDWTAKIFSEDCKESAIMWTHYHKARLTYGSWSPTRYSVYFTTRSDGVLDVWDILQQQNQAILSLKICDEELNCLRTHEMGRLVAVGNKAGTTNLVEFSENLSLCNKNDKMLLTSMFEREAKREKIIEGRNRELRLKQKTRASAAGLDDDGEGEEGNLESLHEIFKDSQVVQAEKEFYETVTKLTKPPAPVDVTPPPEVAEHEEEPEEVPPPPLPPSPPRKEKGKKKKKKKTK